MLTVVARSSPYSIGSTGMRVTQVPRPGSTARMRVWRFVSIMSSAVSMSAAFAHLMELPAKMKYEPSLYVRLHRTLYPTYGKTAGIAEILSVLTTLGLAWLRCLPAYRHGRGFTDGGSRRFLDACFSRQHHDGELAARFDSAGLEAMARSVGVHARRASRAGDERGGSAGRLDSTGKSRG